MPLGTVKALTGTALAAIDYFKVTLRGRSSHGAHPHQGIDTVGHGSAGGECAGTRFRRARIDALESAIISIGQIHGGTSDIVLPETVELRGSVRTLKPEVRERVEELFMRAQ